MKSITRLLSVVAVSLSCIFTTQAIADDDLCTMAKMNLIEQGPRYEAIFDEIVRLLNSNDIPYIEHGGSCTDTYGGCGADMFEVDTHLKPDSSGVPTVGVMPFFDAINNGGDYYLVGKLEGLVGHQACGLDTEYLNGHAWAAAFTQGKVAANVGSWVKVGTTLSKAGHVVAKGYTRTQTTGFNSKTILVQMKDFVNSPSTYSEFVALKGEISAYY
jgi:hypothetical protein